MEGANAAISGLLKKGYKIGKKHHESVDKKYFNNSKRSLIDHRQVNHFTNAD